MSDQTACFSLLRLCVPALLLLVATLTFAQTTSPARLQSGAITDQSLDFEASLAGWTRTGSAFDLQPVNASSITTDKVGLVKLGGDYWRDLSYPLGQHGNFLIFTSNARTGTLTSSDFVLDNTRHFLSFLIGGSANLASERIELQVLSTTEADARQLEQSLQQWHARSDPRRITSALRDGPYIVAFSATADEGADRQDLDALQQKVLALPGFLTGRMVRIRIVDDSTVKHIALDDIRFTENPPLKHRAPVWGYADYHTHPMSHLAFGAAQRINLLWGSPGCAYSDYADLNLISRDIPHCVKGHNGGPTAEVFINNSEQRASLGSTLQILWQFTMGRLTKHGRSGGPEFKNFPSFLSGTHQQMHITQIRRNYDGGLRLLVAIATNNRGAEYLASKVQADGGIRRPTEDRDVVNASVCGMRQLVSLNKDWMEIAYSPDDMRRIIRHNKLAVILGVEVDELGKWYQGDASKEIDELWKLGIRVVTPIHGVDNPIGGAAVFIEVYSWLNDFLHRTKLDLTVDELKQVPPTFFTLREAGCGLPQADPREECVPFRFETTQRRVAIAKIPLLGRIPFPETVPAPTYEGFTGEKNAKGLTPYGETYIDQLMKQGMIIDTAHMSDLSVRGVYDRIGSRLKKQHPECGDFSFYQTVSDPCLDSVYPAIVSHVHFRAEGRPDGGDFLSSEYFISDHNIEAVRRVGGVLGPFVTQDSIVQRVGAPFDNDCSMSSKGFGFSFRYGLQKMHGWGIGMATDFTFIPGISPRFGPNACWAYHLADDPDRELQLHPLLYDRVAQRDGVVYSGMNPDKKVRYGHNVPLEPYRMGPKRRPFDFNLDGLAHFGLIPDMLQDLKNLGMSTDDFEALFSSSESYLQMWEKVWRNSDVKDDSAPDLTIPLCDAVCRGSCLAPPTHVH